MSIKKKTKLIVICTDNKYAGNKMCNSPCINSGFTCCMYCLERLTVCGEFCEGCSIIKDLSALDKLLLKSPLIKVQVVNKRSLKNEK